MGNYGLHSLHNFHNLFLLILALFFLQNLDVLLMMQNAMPNLERAVIVAILQALLQGPSKLSILRRFLTFFTLIRVPLQRFQHELFKKLREEAWSIDEEGYRQSFHVENDEGKLDLHPLSELGYSGSVSESHF